MKKTIIAAIIAAATAAVACDRNSDPAYKDASRPVDERVADLLGRMTLEEKIMQLNQYTVGDNDNANNIGEAVAAIPATIGSLIYMSDDAVLRNATQKHAMEDSRLGIPILFGYDVIHGYRTIAPIPLAQACSRNPELVTKCASNSAAEAWSSGIDWTFSPMVDIAHDPRWGRVAEGYGEDPYTASVFSAAAVRGYQGDDLSAPGNIASCLKHYIGYGASEAGRDYVYTEISRQSLWDTYLPSFKAGVEAGARSAMSAFNNISGTPATANHYTLTEVMKNRWKLNGFIVSDWDAVKQLVTQGMAADEREAALLAFKAGLDMDMVDNVYCKCLASLVESGDISEREIDESVRRILKLKFDLGLFDHPYTDIIPDSERILQPSARADALALASESMVLLKNEDALLPLKGQRRIALVGPLVDDRLNLLGSWLGRGKAEDAVTVREGMNAEFANADILYSRACDFENDDRGGFADAVRAARASDVVVYCMGERNFWSGENASRSTISLPAVQEELLKALKATGRPVVVVITAGRPLDLTRIEKDADAILYAWQLGVEGGNAIAGALSGKFNPSGKLAITFPYTQGQIPIYYNRRPSSRTGSQGLYQDITSEPLYPYGYGLSYSDFVYGDMTLSAENVSRGGKITASVDVTNDSAVDGMETVQWFISDPACTVTRPVKEMRHFEKRLIKAGTTETFKFEIDPDKDLAFVDDDGQPVLESGEFRVSLYNGDAKVFFLK